MRELFEDPGLITDEERANVKAHAEKTRERGMEHVKVVTAAIPIIRQQSEDD